MPPQFHGDARGWSGLTFARLLAALAIADFLSLVFLNLLQCAVAWTPLVFVLSCAASYALVRRIRWRRETPTADPWPWVMAAIACVLLALPRVPYVLEWLPGNTVGSVMDDYARIPEVASMVLSPRYPLQHPANPEYLLSFYYTALYPMAALKLLLPWLTIKDSIFAGNLLIHALALGSMVGIAQLLVRDRGKVRLLVFLVALFGGLDWLMKTPWRWLGHSEWWQGRFLGNTQISSFYTSMLWAVHHASGFMALLLAWLVLFHARAGRRAFKSLIVLLLLAAAFYSSPFAVMSAPLFALAHLRVVWRRLVATPAFALVLALALVPLFLFLGKPSTIGFTVSGFRIPFTGSLWADKLLSLPVYLTLVPLVEFGGTPFLVLAWWRRLQRVERRYFLAAAGFFLLTYGVAFIGANDFCMRGMMLPTFVFFALFARHADPLLRPAPAGAMRALRTTLATIAVLGALGTAKEWATLTFAGLYRSTLFWDLRHRTDLPPGLARLRQLNARAIARDRRITRVPYAEVANLGYDMYSLEKLVDRKPLVQMERGEVELLRYPRRGFLR